VELVQRYSKLANLSKLCPSATVRPVPVAPPRIHNAQKRLGPDLISQLVTDYQAGASTTDLMVSYGLGKGTVLRLLRDNGVQLRHQSLTAEQLKEAIQLYQQGWTLARVGNHFGRDASFIHVTFKRAGVPRRDNHGRERHLD
jgi:hypothetical protein